MRLYGEILSEGIIDRTGAQTMLYLTCTTITRVDLARYRVSRAKDWLSVNCGANVLMDLNVQTLIGRIALNSVKDYIDSRLFLSD